MNKKFTGSIDDLEQLAEIHDARTERYAFRIKQLYEEAYHTLAEGFEREFVTSIYGMWQRNQLTKLTNSQKKVLYGMYHDLMMKGIIKLPPGKF